MPSTLIGIPASPGIVVGPVYLLRWEVPEVPTRTIHEREQPAELERLHGALAHAVERLRAVRERAERHAGPAEAAIFDVQISIIEDQELRARVESVVRQNFSAERAFDVVMLEWREHFARSQHAMMRDRVTDLTDVHIRVLSILLGLPDHDPVDVPPG
ncbi:MAG: phosphoenolpyruvate-utilizing N-terminal domain-containing protein, partial [Gemmatimonadales bacterium]